MDGELGGGWLKQVMLRILDSMLSGAQESHWNKFSNEGWEGRFIIYLFILFFT